MRFEYTPEAERDLDDIFEYTHAQFGFYQAEKYLNDLDHSFVLLTQNPRLGRARNDLRKGVRSLVHEHHVIFYRIDKSGIFILRVLHGSRDVAAVL